MLHEVEQREVCRAMESLTQTVVPGVLLHSACTWLQVLSIFRSCT